MKKIIFAAAAVFAFGMTNAQEARFGAKGALNFATITNSEGAKNKVGFAIGGFAEIKVSDKFAVQPELMYSLQGAKYDGGSAELNYINIPVMAKYFVTEEISLQAGPQLGILMSATAKSDGGGSSDFKDQTKAIDFGLNFGAGYNIGEDMMIDLRYNLGLSQIEKELASGQTASKNAVIQLGFGYKF
jgi:opacity protein-like surface antigen